MPTIRQAFDFACSLRSGPDSCPGLQDFDGDFRTAWMALTGCETTEDDWSDLCFPLTYPDFAALVVDRLPRLSGHLTDAWDPRGSYKELDHHGKGYLAADDFSATHLQLLPKASRGSQFASRAAFATLFGSSRTIFKTFSERMDKVGTR
ncbi:hypothetical protein HDV03_000241 [Kappamyces sp. JEL0829]|nr:hypothetical protein HDV03_000241 [Kappamyces sp. JEL0829]